jgi:hypothetical protein
MCAECFIKDTPVPFQGCTLIDITGRANLCSNIGKVNALGLQAAIAVVEVVHDKVVPVIGRYQFSVCSGSSGKYSGPFCPQAPSRMLLPAKAKISNNNFGVIRCLMTFTL